MPRKPRIPKYSLHKPSGRARVIVDGQHIWLGKCNSEESIEKYNRLVAKLATSPSNAAASRPVDLGSCVNEHVRNLRREEHGLGTFRCFANRIARRLDIRSSHLYFICTLCAAIGENGAA